MTTRALLFLLIAALTAGVALAAPAPVNPMTGPWPVRKSGEDSIIDTPHYNVKTDLGEEAVQVIGAQQEALYAELFRRMGSIKPQVAVGRYNILAVAKEERYKSEVGPDAVGGGLFMEAKNLLAVWGPLPVVLRSLRHEGTHQFVRNFIGGLCPLWLNEGLAEYYQQSEFLNGRLEVGMLAPGWVRAMQAALREKRYIPVRQMLTIDHKKWQESMRGDQETASIQYAEVWSFMHFLVYGDNNRYLVPFQQYIFNVSRGRTGEKGWEAAFGNDYAGFEARWREYVLSLNPVADLECRRHLLVIGGLVAYAREQKEFTASLPVLRQALVDRKLGGWTVTVGGKAYRSTDAGLVALFRCPLDKSTGDAPSYEMVRGPIPPIRCRHHTGMVYETIYDKAASGEITPALTTHLAKEVK